jgi:predicted ArsR family transcriptional regulator
MTRVQQDYEFKTATALAFEAHKKEIVEADDADKELTKQFLKVVTANFGDNPVRLLPNSNNEHGHPIEELIAKVSDDKTFERLVKVFESLKGKQ